MDWIGQGGSGADWPNTFHLGFPSYLCSKAMGVDFVETFAMDPKASAKTFHLASVQKKPLHYYELLEQVLLLEALRHKLGCLGRLCEGLADFAGRMLERTFPAHSSKKK